MKVFRFAAVRALTVAGACGLLLAAGALPASAATETLSGSGSGTEEVPAGAASDKVSGTFDIDTTAGTLTYKISFQGSEPATMGHIHKGAAGVSGPVVVPFDAAVINAGGSATLTVDPTLLDEILADPAGYYVNVHTASAPAGAARGQLMSGSGTAPSAVSAGTGGQFAALHDNEMPLIALGVGGALVLAGAAGALTVRRRS